MWSCSWKAGSIIVPGQRRNDEKSLWLVVQWMEGGLEARDQEVVAIVWEGEGAGWRAGQKAGQAGGRQCSLWRLLRGGPEPGPRGVWGQS